MNRPSRHSCDGDERARLLAENDRFLDALERLCRSIYVLGEATPRAMDAVVSLGELAARLRQQGVTAQAVDATGRKM